MDEHQQSLADLQHIKKMMERSSRFISLSGLSGVSAGVCAIMGAFVAYPFIFEEKEILIYPAIGIIQAMAKDYTIIFNTWLFWIAAATFTAALLFAFLFTWRKSKKEGIPVWGATSKRVVFNLAIPLLAGGIFIFRMLFVSDDNSGLIAPACLIFYGLALINASKYTLFEVRQLGFIELILGFLNLWFVKYGFYFWVVGFGIFHIVYGSYMWWKYERK